MTRGGADKDRANGPERKCIATGDVQPKGGLIRFVVGPDNHIYPDVMEKLPGRGIYVSAAKEALELAQKKGLFSKAAKAKVVAPDDLIAVVDHALVARFGNLMALSRKAGHAVVGFEKVKDWLVQEYAEVLLQASDGSERGKSKLSTPRYGRFIGCLTANELGLAFGRESVIHGALASGGLTDGIVETAAKLEAIREWNGVKARRKGKALDE